MGGSVKVVEKEDCGGAGDMFWRSRLQAEIPPDFSPLQVIVPLVALKSGPGTNLVYRLHACSSCSTLDACELPTMVSLESYKLPIAKVPWHLSK